MSTRAATTTTINRVTHAAQRRGLWLIVVVLSSLVLASGTYVIGAQPVQAQAAPGAICVATFADENENGARDLTEGPLSGVNVNLSTGGAIIATHVLAEDEALFCFENLLPGVYTVTFTSSVAYRATTANQGTFVLESGQRLTINDFGAQPVPPEMLRAAMLAQIAANQPDPDPLSASTRLLLATSGAMVVMLFMIGIGAIILGMLNGRRARRQQSKDSGSAPPQPGQLRPPS